MPNYIGFKEDVDRYYRHYNTESAWGSVLANKVRQYNAYNQGILNQANQQNLNTIQYAQNEVSSIYSSYAQNRKAMENSGLSKYFTQRIFDDANPISRVAQQRAQQIISKNYVTPKLANINEDSAVQAYQQQVTGVSNMMSDMIQFFAENMVTKDGRQYQLADLVNDGYITKVGDGYQLTAAGISKLSELTAETEEGNPFETWMQDKYGDKYDQENAALYYQEASKMFGNEELAEGLPIAKPEGQVMPTDWGRLNTYYTDTFSGDNAKNKKYNIVVNGKTYELNFSGATDGYKTDNLFRKGYKGQTAAYIQFYFEFGREPTIDEMKSMGFPNTDKGAMDNASADLKTFIKKYNLESNN